MKKQQRNAARNAAQNAAAMRDWAERERAQTEQAGAAVRFSELVGVTPPARGRCAGCARRNGERQVVRGNLAWEQAVEEMVARGEKTGAAPGDPPQNFTAAGGEKTPEQIFDVAKKITALPEAELYAYGLGQSWVFRFPPRGARKRSKYIQYTIRSCREQSGTQYYGVAMQDLDCDAVNTAELSSSRLHFLINFHLYTAVCAGARQALPLPRSVVEAWYEEKRKKAYAESEWVQRLLQTHKPYTDAEKKRRALEIEQARAEYTGDARHAAELGAEAERQRAESVRLREKLGITDAVLNAEPHCAVCGDRGYLLGGRQCPCVKENEAAIRRYWRAERGEAEQ